MLDMGFKPAVDRIVAKTPRDRQTLFFSATLEAAAGKVAARLHATTPRRHVHEPAEEDRATSRTASSTSPTTPRSTPSSTSCAADRGRTLVFVRTKRGADRLVKRLVKQRVDAVAMHGNKSPEPAQTAPWRNSQPATSTPSSPPTSPPAGSTSTRSPT